MLSILHTWGCFKMRVVHGTKREESLRAAREREAEVFLTTYSTYTKHVEDFVAVPWEVAVFDEAHYLKNKDAVRTQLVLPVLERALASAPVVG